MSEPQPHNLKHAISNAVRQSAREISKIEGEVTEEEVIKIFTTHLNEHIASLVLSELKPKGEVK